MTFHVRKEIDPVSLPSGHPAGPSIVILDELEEFPEAPEVQVAFVASNGTVVAKTMITRESAADMGLVMARVYRKRG